MADVTALERIRSYLTAPSELAAIDAAIDNARLPGMIRAAIRENQYGGIYLDVTAARELLDTI